MVLLKLIISYFSCVMVLEVAGHLVCKNPGQGHCCQEVLSCRFRPVLSSTDIYLYVLVLFFIIYPLFPPEPSLLCGEQVEASSTDDRFLRQWIHFSLYHCQTSAVEKVTGVEENVKVSVSRCTIVDVCVA